MSIAYVSLLLDLFDGQGNQAVSGSAVFTPSAVLTDAGVEVADQYAVTGVFRAGSLPSVKLLATDGAGLLPTGWTWGVAFAGRAGAPAGFNFFLPANPTTFTATDATPCVFTAASGSYLNGTGVQLAGGSLPAGFSASTTYYVVNVSGSTFELAATAGGTAIGSTSAGSGSVVATQQFLSNLIPVSSGTAFQAYMPLPSGTPSPGQVPGATGSGEASAWTTLTAASVGADASGAAATQAAAAQAAAIAASLPTLTQASVSVSGTLAVNVITEVTATSGTLTMTLPAPAAGDLLVCERASASTASVAVTGSMRGVANSTITLQLGSESEMFFAYGSTWWPIAGHKTLSSLQALFLQIPNYLSEIASAGSGAQASARTNLGLGSAATQPSSAFDAAGLAASAQSAAQTFATSAVATEASRAEGVEALKANLAGAAFTGEVTVQAPVNASDAVTKAYADAIAQGLSVKPSVQEATTAALPANTYANGTAGVGATLTAIAAGVLTVDGIAVALNDRILVQNEVTASHNGIYTATTLGTVGVPYVLTRAADMNAASQVPGAFVFAEQGTANASAGFAVVSEGPFTIGTTAITWTQFSGAGEVAAGTGLTKSGNTIALATPVSIANGGTGAATASPNVVFAGPASGGSAAPSYRALAAADIPALSYVASGAASQVAYGVANSQGYAVQNFDCTTAYLNNVANLLKNNAWPAGQISINRIPAPFALSGMAGTLCFGWRKFTGTGAANAYIGVYTLAGGTLTRQYVSSDLSTLSYGNPNTLSAGSVLQTIAADTATTALYVAILIGTQDSAGMGPICIYAPALSGAQSSAPYGGAPMDCGTLSGSATSLPATMAYSSFTYSFGYSKSWWGVR